MSARAPINFLLLFMLVLRSLLPAGFMVQAASAQDGTFEIVICTSAGPKVVHAADGGDKNVPAPKSQAVDDGLCPFATAGSSMLAEAPGATLIGEATYAAVTYTLAAAQFAETPKPGAASARGPPSQLI